MTRRQLLIARILLVVYIITVLVLCFGRFESTEEIPREFLGIPMDKIVHFLMFLPLPFLAFFAFDRYTDKFWPSVLWTSVTFIAGSLFAAGTEIGQALLTSYRSGDPTDFRADLVALALGSLVVLILDLSKQKEKE